ncbi:MAG: hypothetical protein U1G08_00260 [Verrucomicrobiota bacterium]
MFLGILDGLSTVKPMKISFQWAIAVIALLAASGWICIEYMQQAALDRQWVRYRVAASLGNALERYRLDHGGKLPGELSGVVPDYISIAQISNHVGQVSGKWSVQSILTNFSYLGEPGLQLNLVMCESANVWVGEHWFGSKRTIVVLTSNFTASAFPESVVLGKLRELDSAKGK